MKLKFFAGLMLLLSLAMSYGAATPRHTVAFSSVRRFGGNTGTLTVGNTAGLSTTNFTPGSYISAATVDGSNAVSADISGTWGGGTVSLVFVPINATGASGMTHTVPAAQITQFSTGQPSGITAGATDLFSTTVNGAGTIYAVTPSGLTGSVTVTLRVGPGMSLLSALINSLPLPTGASTSALQTTGNTSLASILSQLQGTLLIAQAGTLIASAPASWATGTDWNASSSPALPSTIKKIWIDIAPGSTCTLKIDGGGQTGFTFGNIQTGWWIAPPGLSVSKIYAPANGSTGAVIKGVIY